MRTHGSTVRYDTLDSLANSNQDRILFSGTAEKGLVKDILKLPIELPSGYSYLISIANNTLYIASTENVGISKFRLAARQAHGIDTEVTTEGVTFSNFKSKFFDKVVLLKVSVDLPDDALPLSMAEAPLNLLNQYADLRNKSAGRKLNPKEQAELRSIINQFQNLTTPKERIIYQRDTTSYSSRSTPTDSGESRGGGSSSTFSSGRNAG